MAQLPSSSPSSSSSSTPSPSLPPPQISSAKEASVLSEPGGSQSLVPSSAPAEPIPTRAVPRPLSIDPSASPTPTSASISASPTAATSVDNSSRPASRVHWQRANRNTPSMTSGSQLGMRNRLSSSSSPSLRNSPSEPPSTARNSDAPADDDSTNNGSGTAGSATRDTEDTRSITSHRSSTTVGASRPSLLSRLSLPLQLRSRNRNIADFHIRPLEPHKQYAAGEQVLGSVILVVVKPIRITHLTVTLSGIVRALKEPGVGTKSHPILPTGGLDRPQYHGNGVVTLFQDEQVLSGDGRLDAGKYEFGFDLAFPVKGLPSSIDFERGTISYIITATLTRPTSIAPTTSCERKVMLVEKLDIGHLPPPRPKTIFLEPMYKRSRRRKSTVLDKTPSAAIAAATGAAAAASDVNDYTSEAGSIGPSVVTEESSRDRTVEGRHVDQSDIRSEISGESGRSVSTSGLSRADLAQVASAKQQVVDDKTIVATVEMLRGGCLPGDTVSIRVIVNHIKRVKSINGVIVTLYRQGKVDSSPSSSLFADSMTEDERRRADKQDTFPRSRTGLGGLSLSSSGPTSVFRKDLDQITAPLLIHPTTLSANVTVSVKLPDDSFPTIRNVPGEIVSFKYQVEVIVDLGGRLSHKFQGGQSRVGQINSGGVESNNIQYSSRAGASIADTGALKREKGVIAVTLETVVGTMDSSRTRIRARASQSSRTLRTATQSDDDEAYHTEHSLPDDSQWGTPYVNGQSSNHYFAQQHTNDHRRYGPPLLPPPSHQHPQTSAGLSQPYPYQANGDYSGAAPEYIPPPEVPDERNMTDKERIRQAETRLLPSQPPGAGSAPTENGVGSSSSNTETNANNNSNTVCVTADDIDDIYDQDETPRIGHASPSLGAVGTIEGVASAPPPEGLEGSVDTNQVQDKQEIERRRLLNEASAPPDIPDDLLRQAGPSTAEPPREAEPSAPNLTEDEEYNGFNVGAGSSSAVPQHHHHHNEQLPAYER